MQVLSHAANILPPEMTFVLDGFRIAFLIFWLIYVLTNVQNFK